MYSEELVLKRRRHSYYSPDLIEYAFVGVSLLDAKLWEESIKMNHATPFLFFQIILHHYLTPEKSIS